LNGDERKKGRHRNAAPFNPIFYEKPNTLMMVEEEMLQGI
jgi:hypothetical protein